MKRTRPPSRKPARPRRQETDPATTRAEIEILRNKLTELVEKSPEKAATILTDWVKGQGKKRKRGRAA